VSAAAVIDRVSYHEQLSWAGDIGTPRILIVVTVPADVSDWMRLLAVPPG